MEFYDVLKQRRSIRGYKPESVPDSTLEHIMQAVQLAPTACNRQPFQLLLVKDTAVRAKICAACQFKFLTQAPVLAVMLTNESEAWTRFEGNSAADIDASIVMEHFVLSAAAEGLGTCWICAFDRKDMDEALGIEPPYRSFAISPLGFAAETPRPFVRKNLNEIIKIIG